MKRRILAGLGVLVLVVLVVELLDWVGPVTDDDSTPGSTNSMQAANPSATNSATNFVISVER